MCKFNKQTKTKQNKSLGREREIHTQEIDWLDVFGKYKRKKRNVLIESSNSKA